MEQRSPPSLPVRPRSPLAKLLVRSALWLERLRDRMIWGLRRRYGSLGPLRIAAYRSFGTHERVFLRGRVLEASELSPSAADDGLFANIRRTLRVFRSRELPHAALRASLGGARAETESDVEGYFELSLPAPEASLADQDWYIAEVELIGSHVKGWTPVRAHAEVLIPSASADFGIVSDIDDTVLQTFVQRRLKMLWLTLAGSAFTRETFEGTSELFAALKRGRSGAAQNPVFYVSKSPWNLYDFLVHFLERNGLPRGPLFLRDLGLHEQPQRDFKARQVRLLFDTYPALSFVLIGDSGELDPEVYLSIAARYPGRVLAIYIRDVAALFRAEARLTKLRGRAQELGTELVLVADAYQALAHARERRLVASPLPELGTPRVAL